MKKTCLTIGRIFYGLAITFYGIQQFIYADFRSVLFPPWQHQLPALSIWAYLFGIYLVASGLMLIIGRNTRKVALVLGAIFLFLFCFLHIPYELISEPNKTYHLGLWISALKEFALAGGAFVIAGVASTTNIPQKENGAVMNALDKITPYGSLFFCITIIIFGVSHFIYADFVKELVPSWMPDHLLWNYIAAVALIGAGVFIILDIRMRVIAWLLSITLFLWVWLLHVPGAINDPRIDRGNNLASAFDALAFCGTALCIAFGVTRQKWVADLEKL
jgi:uncharacterized membrane protein YphA (DoxX/SURF4 family)